MTHSLKAELATAGHRREVRDVGRGCPQVVVPPEARQAERPLEVHLRHPSQSEHLSQRRRFDVHSVTCNS